MPGIIASRLRALLQERIVTPSVHRLPWLKDQLAVI
jgi:hypothetical protein